MKPYPAYKDSGIEWIGEIPEHWEIKKLKHLFEFLDYKRIPLSAEVRGDMEKIYDYYGASGVIDKVEDYLFDETLILVGEDGANLLSRSTPLAFLAKGKYWVNNHAHILKPKYGDINYFVNLLESIDYTTRISGSAQPKLTAENLGDVFTIKPPFSEQQSITAYLDYKTSQLDTLIEKKQKQIELLKEERIAIINQAVTKGLYPDVPMKDSGIEWLGEVPEHWEIKPLKYLLLDGKDGIKIGPFGSSLKSNILTEDGFKVYGQENIINNDFSIGHRFIDDVTFEELNVYEIFEGDVLITMMGTTGKSKVVPSNIQKGIMDSHLIRIRTRASVNPHLISRLINDSHYIFSQIKQNSKGSIMEGLNSSIIKSLVVLCPPKSEQDSILSFIDRTMKEIEYELNVTENQITLLQEYRTALISNAVTGKIDVRDTPTAILE